MNRLKSSGGKQWWKENNSIIDNKNEDIEVEEIMNYSPQQQVEMIATKFASISQEYEPLNRDEIGFPPFNNDDIPRISEHEVGTVLEGLNLAKAEAKCDIPSRIYKHFSNILKKPITMMLNNAIVQGKWPKFLKLERCTPIPKVPQPKTMKDLRCISGIMNMSKIMEKIVCKLVMEDLKPNIHPGQFAGLKGLGTDHYLVKMVDRILRSLDCSTSQESTAVIASFIDWADAFPRVQHTLGMKSFIQNGLRPSLLPLVCNYFEDRRMVVRWKNATSQEHELPSSTPQGSSFGVAEFLSISNDNANSVPEDNKYSYMDDLSLLEIINLINIGIASYNSKVHVASVYMMRPEPPRARKQKE